VPLHQIWRFAAFFAIARGEDSDLAELLELAGVRELSTRCRNCKRRWSDKLEIQA
jgi:hypothetical protein